MSETTNIKVGIDVSSVVYGTGVSHYTLSLLQSLPAKIMRPIGFSLRRRSQLQHLVPSAHVFPLPPSAMNLLWNRLHVLPAQTFTGSIDVFHSSDWTEPPSLVPKVTTIHDLTPFLFPDQTLPQIVQTHTAKMRWAVQECDKFICVSQSTANDLQKIFSIPTQKISVIYEAAATNLLLSPMPSPYSSYILAMGSRQPRKNIARLIRAYKSSHLKQKLVITGENSLISDDPNIIFTGYVSDQQLVNLFAGAEVFVYPSIYEGFGQPILAAFQFGIPVVAANTSSLPEVAGEAAILVDPLSESAIINGISEAISQKKHLVTAGKKQLAKFSWTKAAAETLAVYKSLC